MSRGIYIVIGVLSLLVGCAAPLQQVQINDAIQITESDSVKPIAITKVAATIRRGTDVGDLNIGWACVKNDDINWKSGSKVNLSNEDLVDVFREELEINGWPVVGSTEDLFEGYDISGAEVLVAARILDLEAQMCAPNAGFGNWDMKGSMRMEVEWQVYSPARKTRIGEVVTLGSALLEKTSDDAAFLLLSDSFSVAVNNLISRGEFLSLVEKSKGLSESPNIEDADIIENPENDYKTLEEALMATKNATVTIRTASGHGSGFAVGDGSYILTNAHVVGNAKNVTVVAGSGIEIEASVEASSRERDVALIRISAIRLPALHIQRKVPESGTNVYAVGSPFIEEMSGSVTSGIVSGTRTMDGYEWIQSDTSINPGNSGGPLIDQNGAVVGISTAGFQASGSQVGLNLFIPIVDALAFSGLKIE